MSRQSPSARTTAWLEAQGYTVERVEQRLTRVVTKDFMGFADLLALHEMRRGVLAVQATTTSNLSKRVAKVLAEPRARLWLACGNRIWCIGWSEWESSTAWVAKKVVIYADGPIEEAPDGPRPYRLRGGKVSIAP